MSLSCGVIPRPRNLEVSFTHVLCEVNYVADRLVKMDSRGINGSEVFFSPPDFVRDLLQADRDSAEETAIGRGLRSRQGLSAIDTG
ncbi:hypothetical protein V6N12_046421 [Hibiscus sabdariffa]|uniref:RNase H type-1 domain-containing protein n=1 Tax=Hibiscus sabdariffa TaxID=183260 RepID=A0ABR2DJ18_9ROSI